MWGPTRSLVPIGSDVLTLDTNKQTSKQTKCKYIDIKNNYKFPEPGKSATVIWLKVFDLFSAREIVWSEFPWITNQIF